MHSFQFWATNNYFGSDYYSLKGVGRWRKRGRGEDGKVEEKEKKREEEEEEEEDKPPKEKKRREGRVDNNQVPTSFNSYSLTNGSIKGFLIKYEEQTNEYTCISK